MNKVKQPILDSYYDGIPPELKEQLEKLTPEELEKLIEEEKKKSDALTSW